MEYQNFLSLDAKTLTRMMLPKARGLLRKKYFLRIHKSFLVNLNHVQKMERHQIIFFNLLQVLLQWVGCLFVKSNSINLIK